MSSDSYIFATAPNSYAHFFVIEPKKLMFNKLDAFSKKLKQNFFTPIDRLRENISKVAEPSEYAMQCLELLAMEHGLVYSVPDLDIEQITIAESDLSKINFLPTNKFQNVTTFTWTRSPSLTDEITIEKSTDCFIEYCNIIWNYGVSLMNQAQILLLDNTDNEKKNAYKSFLQACPVFEWLTQHTDKFSAIPDLYASLSLKTLALVQAKEIAFFTAMEKEDPKHDTLARLAHTIFKDYEYCKDQVLKDWVKAPLSDYFLSYLQYKLSYFKGICYLMNAIVCSQNQQSGAAVGLAHLAMKNIEKETLKLQAKYCRMIPKQQSGVKEACIIQMDSFQKLLLRCQEKFIKENNIIYHETVIADENSLPILPIISIGTYEPFLLPLPDPIWQGFIKAELELQKQNKSTNHIKISKSAAPVVAEVQTVADADHPLNISANYGADDDILGELDLPEPSPTSRAKPKNQPEEQNMTSSRKFESIFEEPAKKKKSNVCLIV